MPKTWPTTCPIGARFLRVHVPLRTSLSCSTNFREQTRKCIIVWFDTSSVPNEAVFARMTPLRRGRVQIEMIEAVAERDQALAAAVQAHVREGGLVEAVALHHRDVHIAQRLGQRRAVCGPRSEPAVPPASRTARLCCSSEEVSKASDFAGPM